MFLVPFRSPTSSRGPLPIFRNYFFGHSGSPGNLSNSGPLPPHLPQTRASRPGYPARPIRSASGPPWLSLPAPSSRSGPGLGQEFAWWARARSEVGVFCARAPPRPARRGGGWERSGGRAREASGGPGPGFFRLPVPGWVCGLLEARKTGPASLSTDPSASSALTSAGPGLARLGLGEEEQALELGRCCALYAATFAAEP